MRQSGMNTAIILSSGKLKPTASGYIVDTAYPQIETILSLADEAGMQVYLGSLQLSVPWESGLHTDALRKYNRQVASDILARFGDHPSLTGWYFTQEIWLNWVKYYGPNYLGTTMLHDFVSDMATLDPNKPVCTSTVFKKNADRSMPGLSAEETGFYAEQFLAATHLAILMPQDGAGAAAGAPAVEELPAYYGAFQSATTQTATQLWSIVETFSAVPGLDQDRFSPASAARVQAQIEAEQPFVSNLITWVFGNDMSPQATYYPVEASALFRGPSAKAIPLQFTLAMPGNAALQDECQAKLGDRTGGGYNDPKLSSWVAFQPELSGGTVTIVADAGALKQIASVRALSLSQTASAIRHPSTVQIELSEDGIAYAPARRSANTFENTTNFSIGWTEFSLNEAARYVRFTFTHQGWLYLSELEIIAD